MRPKGKSGATMLGSPRSDGRERFFELGGGDLLPAPPCEQHEPAPAIEGQGDETAAAPPPDEVAGLRMAGAVLGGRDRRGRGVDQADEILAGDVGINPVAECFFFPLKPSLEARCVEITRCRPVEETEQASGNAMMNLEAAGGHQAADLSARRSATRCLAAHTSAAKRCLQGSRRRRQSVQPQRPSPARDTR